MHGTSKSVKCKRFDLDALEGSQLNPIDADEWDEAKDDERALRELGLEDL